MNEVMRALQKGNLHDPFQVLGFQKNADGESIIRAFFPTAEHVCLEDKRSLLRIEGSDIFEIAVDKEAVGSHYALNWKEKGSGDWHHCVSPYSFLPQTGELDLHLFGEGKHRHAQQFMGAHLKTIDEVDGCLFTIWAPAVKRISIVGDFNAWDGRRHPMRSLGASGVWELFIPGLQGGDAYKFEIKTNRDVVLLKTDPYARQMALRPNTVSYITPQPAHRWQDKQWLESRTNRDWLHAPLSVYEVHCGSWQRGEHGEFLSWRQLADRLIPYVKSLNYTHIELMPIAEHPLDQSWGYQVTGFYAPTARFGSPDDLRFFIDQCHQNDIGVLLDWVPAHFPRDSFALAKLTGEALYEHADPRLGEHKDWGTLIFNYGRNEVKNFLVANALYWLEEFHFDGLRVDAVASMLYLDYSREAGEWLPNKDGGRENLEAIEFLKEVNVVVNQEVPGVLTMAEESTAWPMVSRPVDMGGLGFSMKWNMGWMNDNLAYIEENPVNRKYHHDKLTFGQLYAYSENFILPLSHDEVVHGKRSLYDKMPGDHWQKMANLRLFYTWQYAQPGKKLLFMGGEIGQPEEWNEMGTLNWSAAEEAERQGLKALISDLNASYRDTAALHEQDFSEHGFSWIDCNDTDQSVVALMRTARDGRSVICIFNFTPVVRENYRIGTPPATKYKEIINTDSGHYCGSNCGNSGLLDTEEMPWMGFEHSLNLTLPPLGALFLESAA